MNRQILFILPMLLLIACGGPAPQSAVVELTDAVKADILSVIKQESESFYKRDFDAWRRSYAGGEVSWTCVEEGGKVLEAKGKKELETLVGDWMKANGEPDTVDIRRENFHFIPTGNSVWVNYDEHQTVKDVTKMLKEVRFITNEKGKWKIAGMNSAFVGYE